MKNFNKGLLSGFGAIICFSIITSFGVIVFNGGVSPISVLIFRALIAGILLFLTILLSKKLSFKIDKKDRLKILVSSILLSVTLILFWQGLNIIRHITTFYAGYFTYPFWMLILSCIFLGKKFDKFKWISLFLGTIGTFFAIGFLPSISFENVNLYGVGLALLSAIVWALFCLFNQQLFKKYGIIVVLFYDFIISFFIFSLFQSPLITIGQITVDSLVYLFMIAIVSTYLAYLFLSNAIKNFGGVNWGITNLSSPIFNGVIAFIILGQIVSIYQAFGIVLSIAGVYLLYKGKKYEEN